MTTVDSQMAHFKASGEFEREYAERSKMTVARLRSHSKVVPCDCGDEICEGWGIVSLDGDNCGECGHYNFHHEESGCPGCTCTGYTTERRWPRLGGDEGR